MNLRLATDTRVVSSHNRPSVLGDTIGVFESETLGVFSRIAPRNEHILLYVLTALLLVATIIASVVKLERVVTSVGVIVTSRGSLYVSPFDTSIVREIRVKVGDVVNKGAVLATLDSTFTHADVKQLRQREASDEAADNRLQAELGGRPYQFSSADPYQSLQFGIWQKRQGEYKSNLADFDARIHAAEDQVAQYQANAEHYRRRLNLAKDVENVYRPLLDKGYVSKLQAMQAADERTEMARLSIDAQRQMSSLRQTLAALKAQRAAYADKWHSDTGVELVINRNDLDATRESLVKAKKLNELSTLNAPENAIVLNVGKASPGSVATGGGAQSVNQGPLFTLVPLDAPVEADVKVEAADVGFIKAGDPVQLKLDAYRFLQHGTAKGIIKTISEGSFTTDDNNTPAPPFFKVKVTITEVRLRNVPSNFRLVPGMTLTGDILVGRRTILSYLIEGALRTGSEAMREP